MQKRENIAMIMDMFCVRGVSVGTNGACASNGKRQSTLDLEPTNTVTSETETRSARALLVDDDDTEIKILGAIFAKHGLDHRVVRTGATALRILEEGQVDIMIADICLPDADGIDLARQARALRPEMPILLLADYKHQPRAQEASALLVAEYVLKPIAIGEVRARIDELLRLSQYPPLPVGRLPEPIPGAGHEEDGRDQAGTINCSLRALRSTELDGSRETDTTLDLRVMFVDPDRSLRREIASTLSDLGCLVVTYASFEQACAAIDDIEPDIVVASPKYLAQWNHLRPFRGPICRPGLIAILKEPGEAAERAVLDLGAHGVLAPPFEKSEISLVLRFVLGSILEECIAAANQRRRRRR